MKHTGTDAGCGGCRRRAKESPGEGHQGFVLSGDGLGLIAGGHGMDPSRPLLAPIERIGPGVPENDNLVQELALVL
jgi:hypothetical protein